MKKTTKPLLLLSFLVLVVLAAPGIGSSLAEPASEVFTGKYDWRDGGSDDLRAEFEPDGDGQWRVTFRFDFDGRENTWKGTAEGSLENGSELTGTASWKRRNWSWSAVIQDGVMRGKHTEQRSRGKTYETGTFEISRP